MGHKQPRPLPLAQGQFLAAGETYNLLEAGERPREERAVGSVWELEAGAALLTLKTEAIDKYDQA